ncbi:hypothetical protein MMC28_000816 [Mycoblastus sanguinarius]|nr:hypothetical protein [Mycoblastus sanguinarius]
MPTNTAAWLPSSQAKLEVKSAPYTTPKNDELVIKNNAVAINPIDRLKQSVGAMVYPWIKYPFILGSDVAGEVVEVGQSVTQFQIGDRVVGLATGTDEKRNRAAESAFQTSPVLSEGLTSSIPANLSYEQAVVIPLGVSTAACGLFQDDQLKLQYPTVPAQKPTGKTLIIWGGSTSVGCNAIQLAVAAGYEVFTTSSPKNFDFVKTLGASRVFNYKSKTVNADMIRALEGKTTVGALSIGSGAADACMDVLNQCNGDKHVAMATYPTPDPPPKNFATAITIWSFLSWSILNYFKSKMRGITTKFIFGFSLIHNHVGQAIFVDFLPKALAEGTFVAAPEPQVIGTGLEHIQAGFDLQAMGMSAKKVVVSL